MNINDLTAKFQEFLREKNTSFNLEEKWDNLKEERWYIDTEEDELIHRFHEFIEQMIKEDRIEIK